MKRNRPKLNFHLMFSSFLVNDVPLNVKPNDLLKVTLDWLYDNCTYRMIVSHGLNRLVDYENIDNIYYVGYHNIDFEEFYSSVIKSQKKGHYGNLKENEYFLLIIKRLLTKLCTLRPEVECDSCGNSSLYLLADRKKESFNNQLVLSCDFCGYSYYLDNDSSVSFDAELTPLTKNENDCAKIVFRLPEFIDDHPKI